MLGVVDTEAVAAPALVVVGVLAVVVAPVVTVVACPAAAVLPPEEQKLLYHVCNELRSVALVHDEPQTALGFDLRSVSNAD